MKMSVIVTNYNQTLERILDTLDSIIAQHMDSFEILYADDCSQDDHREEIVRYFEERAFVDYKLLCKEANVGTVKNNLQAVSVSSGRYIKSIGTGDLLFDPETLSKIYQYGENHDERMFFGKIKTFSQSDGTLLVGDFDALSSPREYDKADTRVLLASQIYKGDWLPGGSLVFTREAALEYLAMLAEDYKVVYVEDFVSALALFDGRVGFLDEDIYWYEWGVGISNGGSKASRKRMYADHSSFYDGLRSHYPDDKLIAKSSRLFELKRFVALHTPVYGLLSRRLASRYIGSLQQARGSVSELFLASCLAGGRSAAVRYREPKAVKRGEDVSHR